MATDTTSETTAECELEDLAKFVLARRRNSLDKRIGTELMEIASVHRHWAEECTDNADHQDRSFPCDEYERGLLLGIAWLKSKVETYDPFENHRYRSEG